MLPPGLLLAWVLARAHASAAASLLETLVSLPLVMPPVATGLILLMLLGRAAARRVCWRGSGSRSCSPGRRW